MRLQIYILTSELRKSDTVEVIHHLVTGLKL